MSKQAQSWGEKVELRAWQVYRRAKNPALEPQPVDAAKLDALEQRWSIKLSPSYREVLSRIGAKGNLLDLDGLNEANPKAFYHRQTKSRPYLGGVVLIAGHGCAMWDELVTKGECAGTVWFIDNGELAEEPLGSFETYFEQRLERLESKHGSGAIHCLHCEQPLDLSSLIAWSCASCGGSQQEHVGAGPTRAEIGLDQWLELSERLIEQLLVSDQLELVSQRSRAAVAQALAQSISGCRGWEQVARIALDTLVEIDAVAEVYADEQGVLAALGRVR